MISGSAPQPLRPDDGRLVRGRLSRARIRNAFRELCQERGFDGTTLRAIAERADMGASSIYRHVRSKHELLVLELSDLQEEAWLRFRASDSRDEPVLARLRRFFEAQHELLADDADLVVIALRATTYPDAPVARRALALQDRAIGLVAEILQSGRRELAPDVDPLIAAQTLVHAASGARLAWANGLLGEARCRTAIESSAELLMRGIGARNPA